MQKWHYVNSKSAGHQSWAPLSRTYGEDAVSLEERDPGFPNYHRILRGTEFCLQSLSQLYDIVVKWHEGLKVNNGILNKVRIMIQSHRNHRNSKVSNEHVAYK